MKENFAKGLDIVLGLEKRTTTNDPNDPGGLTIWGLSKKYNPEIYNGMPTDMIKDIYYRKYWQASGCNEAPYPMDICLFDGAVNPQDDKSLPGGGNQEILNQKPANWQEYCILRMQRYMRCSKPQFVKGHIFRVLILCDQIKKISRDSIKQ
jgi:hypothetical protein